MLKNVQPTPNAPRNNIIMIGSTCKSITTIACTQCQSTLTEVWLAVSGSTD